MSIGSDPIYNPNDLSDPNNPNSPLYVNPYDGLSTNPNDPLYVKPLGDTASHALKEKNAIPKGKSFKDLIDGKPNA